MSRATLVRLAKLNKVSIDGINSGKLSMDQLRVRLLEFLFGPNLGSVKAATADALDLQIARSFMCLRGELGGHLVFSQWCIRKANHERADASRLSKVKSTDRDAIDALLKSAGHYLSMANVSHNLHSLEASLRDGKSTEHCESTPGEETGIDQ